MYILPCFSFLITYNILQSAHFPFISNIFVSGRLSALFGFTFLANPHEQFFSCLVRKISACSSMLDN